MLTFLKKLFHIEQWRRLILLGVDLACFGGVAFAYYSVTWIDSSLQFSIPAYLLNVAVLLACMFLARFAFGIYFNIWRYTNTAVFLKMVIADGIGCLAAALISRLLVFEFQWVYVGVWLPVTVTALTCLLTLTSRFVYRLLYKRIRKYDVPNDLHKIPVAIAGAGQMGALLADELLGNKRSNYKPLFFIDIDKAKVGGRVAGLKVYYQDEAVLDFIQSQAVSEIFIAMTGLDSETATHLYEFYSRTACKIKIYDTPVTDMQDNGQPIGKTRGRIREFQIEDLLFRKTLNINDSEAFNYYKDKTVLVTGGGGSIGSEICRQISKCDPKKLIILDIYENSAYDIQQELVRAYGAKLDLAVEIASVRDRERLDCIFNAYRPDVVFHAAAHKHVPLMEHSGCEAIKNNIMGTYNTADMAEKYGVQKFILISTDKAVNPTNIMGASKRMCEMVVQCRTDSKTSFAAVRFGNVLGSNGSVIPLFKRQIAAGGPITLTDKRIIRYFMTIPEASQLVLQAGAMAKKGELFVLDMGKPVKIYDLAVNMIRMSGFEPNVDIKIEEIGLRPGEKLYEELLMKTETLDKTENNMIFIERDAPLTRREVDEKLARLNQTLQETRNEIASPRIKQVIKEVVPTFHDPSEVNSIAETAEEMKLAST